MKLPIGHTQGHLKIIGLELRQRHDGRNERYYKVKCRGGSERCRDKYFVRIGNFNANSKVCRGCQDCGVTSRIQPLEDIHENLNRMSWRKVG